MNTQTNRGIIGTIVLIIAALIILGYFQINVKSIATSPVVIENLRFAWEICVKTIHLFFEWIMKTIHSA